MIRQRVGALSDQRRFQAVYNQFDDYVVVISNEPGVCQ